MATTSSTFQNSDFVKFGFVLAIEGTELIYTSIADANSAGADGIKAAWAGTDWASVTWRGGLEISGTMSQAVELFDPELKPDTLTFKLSSDEVGSDTNIAQTLLRMASSNAVWTHLDANMDANDTSMTVKDTTNFASSGTVYVGNETIDYSGKTATTFTGLTRGKFNIWETDGAARWSTAHTLNTTNNSAPIVSDTPTDSYNRGVVLYLHHFEDGVWSTRGNAKKLWAGRIKSVIDQRYEFHITAQNFMETLARSTLLSEQFNGPVEEGIWISDNLWRLRVVEEVNGVPSVDVEADMFSVEDRYLWNAVAQAIHALIRPSGTIGTSLNYDWAMFNVSGGGGRKKFHVDTTGIASTTTTNFRVYMSPEIWGLLGFNWSGGDSQDGLIGLRLTRSGNTFHLDGDELPILAYPSVAVGATLDLEDSNGTFLVQTTLPQELGLPSAVDGFLQVGDMKVVAVKQTSANKYTIRRDVSTFFADAGLRLSVPNSEDTISFIRVGEGGGRLQVKQVWWESDSVSALVLRVLLSTGTNAFNHATYDVNPKEIGIGVPANALDIDSFLQLGDDRVSLFMTEPEAFAPMLTSILATSGQYIVWKDGKLTVRRPRYDGSALAAAWTLTESNKGGGADAEPQEGLSRISYSSEGLVNRFQLEYDRSASGKFRRTASVQDNVSISNYGQRRTIKQKGIAIGQANLEPWIANVAAVGLSLFSRPLTKFSRTYNYTLMEMVPTDTVSVSDDYMIDPVAGTRGIGSHPGWLLSTSYNFDEQRGDAEIAMLTDLDPSRIGPWAPSARVDETQTNAGYNAGTLTLTLKANEYSHPTSGGATQTDVEFFDPDDVVHVVELSPPNPAAPIEWTRTIASSGIGTNAMTFTSGLSSPAWDATKKYVVEHSAISGVVAAQKADAFIADDANNSTGDADNDAYVFGGIPDPVSDFSVTSTQRFRRMPDTADDTGNPFSIYKYHDMVRTLNNLQVYKTRAICPNDALIVNETVSGTTSTLAYNPVWVPIFNDSGRGLLIRLRGFVTSGTGTFTVYAGPSRPSGTANNATVYPLDVASVDITTTSTSAVWLTETALLVWPFEADSPPGVWISVEAKNSGAADTTLTAVEIVEDSS